jgi:hypothetical protein
MAAPSRWVAPRIVLPSVDDKGSVDLRTSMVWAIPLDRICYFVTHHANMDWHALHGHLAKWCGSVAATAVHWDGAYITHTGPPSGSLRVPVVAMNTDALLTHPLVPLWCHVVQSIEAADAVIGYGALAWQFDGEVDDWDGANLVSIFDEFITKEQNGRTVACGKRKPQGFQEWSDNEATACRRAHHTPDIITGILFLLKALSGGNNLPDLLVFHATDIVVLNPRIIMGHNVPSM